MSTPAELTTPPTGQDVADFIGQGDDTQLVALAGQHVPLVLSLARSYTRDNGFDGAQMAEDLAAVVTTAAARMVVNPYGAVTEQPDASYSIRYAPNGWTLAELFVLNRYRKRAQ